MKELIDLSTYRPQLGEIAEKINAEAVYLIQYGFQSTKAPYETGNLRDRVKDYNTVSKMLEGFDNQPNELTLEFVANPKDATYGYYIVTGTSTSTNYGRRDYGTLAMNEAEVKQKIRGLQKEIFQDTGEFLNERFQSVLSNSVFKKQ